MNWKTSEMVLSDDGGVRLQVDVVDGETVMTRTYVFVAPGMTQGEADEACQAAAVEAYRQDAARREAEAKFLGRSGALMV